MYNTINIDIGGTFTDCFVVYADQTVSSKVSTTRYNLSVGFNQAIRNCARELGIAVEQLLQETALIRYATTLAMNALLERKGPRLGLITTAGHEDTIFIGRGAQWHDGLPMEFKRIVPRSRRPEPLIPRRMVVGVQERVASNGEIIIPLLEEDVLEKLQYLVDQGSRGFIICLLWAHANPSHEQMIKEIIEREYPDVYLGSQPILLSSEVLPKQNEYQRSMTTVLDGYLHRVMAEELTSLGNELRDKGYQRSLYIVHNTGGCAPLQRTAAVYTYNAGPVAGLIGARYMARELGYPNVIVTDMGGTSFDIGLVVQGETNFYQFIPLIDRWRVGISMIETKSIGAGGGSIAWVNEALGGMLQVGPQSAGSMPGPACFDLGGNEPTVTDADVVLGYVDPDYYLGGRMHLNREKAFRAIQEKVARPLGMEVAEAAYAIKQIVDNNMGNEIFKETNLKGYDPREFVLFAYGGGGPTHCCSYGVPVNAAKIITVPNAAVFSAYGISVMDFRTTYEASCNLMLYHPATRSYTQELEKFNQAVYGLQGKALRDLAVEAREQEILFELELDMRYGLQPNVTRVKSPRLLLNNEGDVKAICEAFEEYYGLLYGWAAAYPQGGIELINLCLWATVLNPKLTLSKYELRSADPAAALKGERDVWWQETGGYFRTKVYQYEQLDCGHHIEGPAIIEALDTTYVIPPGMVYSLDAYHNGIIEQLR